LVETFGRDLLQKLAAANVDSQKKIWQTLRGQYGKEKKKMVGKSGAAGAGIIELLVYAFSVFANVHCLICRCPPYAKVALLQPDVLLGRDDHCAANTQLSHIRKK
jgi:hypothetical protein